MGTFISRVSRATKFRGSGSALTNSDRVNVVRPQIPEHLKSNIKGKVSFIILIGEEGGWVNVHGKGLYIHSISRLCWIVEMCVALTIYCCWCIINNCPADSININDWSR